MARKQKTTDEAQAAILKQGHHKDPLYGGLEWVKLEHFFTETNDLGTVAIATELLYRKKESASWQTKPNASWLIMIENRIETAQRQKIASVEIISGSRPGISSSTILGMPCRLPAGKSPLWM